MKTPNTARWCGIQQRMEGMRTRARILELLRSEGRIMSGAELGERLGLTRAAISLQLIRLAGQGMVQRTLPEEPRRGRRIAYRLGGGGGA